MILNATLQRKQQLNNLWVIGMDNAQFFKIMLVGFFAGVILGNLLHYLVLTFKEDNKYSDNIGSKEDIDNKEIEMNEDVLKKERDNFKSIQEFNYSNIVANKINYDIKVQLREIYKRFGYGDKLRNELELEYDNESYKLVSILQQMIFKGNNVKDIAEKVCNQMRESNLMILLPPEIERIINDNIKK